MAEKDIGKLVIQIEARLDKLESGLKAAESRVNKSSSSMVTSFKSVAGALGLAFGSAQVLQFMRSAIDSFAEAEKAVKKLEIALGKTSTALTDYAGELQDVTAFADENIVEAQAQIAMFVKDEEQIKRLTRATLDLAAAKGMDLSSAAQIVAKSVGSSVNALARYGIETEGAAGSTKRIDTLIKNLNEKFGGQAAGQLDTYAGKVENLKNKFDELKETVGGVLVDAMYGFMDVMNALSEDKYNFLNVMTRNAQLQGIVNYYSKSNAEDKKQNENNGPKQLTDEEKKALEEKKNKQAEFYNTVKFLSDNYYKWQLAQIENEKKEFIAAGISKVDAEALANQKIFELNIDRFNKFQDIQPKGLETIPFTITKPDAMEQLKADYELKLELETEFQKRLLELREDAEITNIDLLDSSYNSMARGFEAMFNKMLIIESRSNSILVQGFVSMANSFISEVGRMIAQWIAFQVIKGVFGAVLAPFTGGASAVAAVAGAAGGNRVEVNPGLGNSGINRNDVNGIVTSIKAMNMNLSNRLDNINVTVINNAPDVRTTVIRNEKIKNRITREGKNLSE